jgi:betaine reductase
MIGPPTTPVVTAARVFMAHGPGLVRYGSKPARDIARDPSVLDAIRGALRSWEAARAYPPNQVFVGAQTPDALRELPRPWFRAGGPGQRRGRHGEIMPEPEFVALLKLCDATDLVALERGFVDEVRPALAEHPLLTPRDLDRLGAGVGEADVEARLKGPMPALALRLGSGRRVGCIVAGHEEDATLTPDVLLENLAAKVTAVMACRTLLADARIEPASIDYVMNSGEEAVGDRYQRGGGNLAKAVAAEAGCARATGVDVKGFCCGPVHAAALAGGLVGSRVFSRVAVVAGGSLAKLGMKYQGHLRAGQPVLEDMLAGVAFLVGADDGHSPRLRLDALGRHTVDAGSSQRAIFERLVAEPLGALGLRFTDVDRYATELHNPELTEPSGGGDVPQLNYRVIAGLAALAGHIDRADVDAFVRTRGLPGFAPTQGHIASALPFLAHALDGLRSGSLERVMFLAKGSLFLGRMTQLADGVSFVLERNTGA